MSETTLAPERRVTAVPRSEHDRMAARPLAQAEVPAGGDVGLPGVVDPVPSLIAIVFSFNAGRSRSAWQGFSLAVVVPGRVRLASGTTRRSGRRCSRRLRLSLITMLIAVPLGHRVRDRDRPVARAAGRRRELLHALLVRDARDHPGRLAVPAVLEPVGGCGPARDHGAAARTGHVPDLLPVHHRAGPPPVDRVRVRGVRDGSGGLADARRSRRVLLPLLAPAILASAALVFADTVDDFVTVRYLSGPAIVRAAVREDLLGARARRRRRP